MNQEQMFVTVAAFTSVHEAHLAKSVLEAAGIESSVADEHLVSMNWTYSNAIGGVKVLVREDRLEEARFLLDTRAEAVDPAPPDGSEGDQGDAGAGAVPATWRTRVREPA